MLYIIKRDGRTVIFDRSKIEEAVLKAFAAVDGDISNYAQEKANNISTYIEHELTNSDHVYSVEEVQDLVEKGLMSSKRKDVARAYITYRDGRTRERNKNSNLIKIIGQKIEASNVQNSNANMDEHSFGGRRGEATNELMKQYALDYCMSKKSRERHLANEIYIHDLDSYAVGMHNCLSIPFDKLLAKGFNTRQTDIRPANSVNTAFQLLAVIFQLQSLQQFGGVSATHLDWTMVPYVRKSFYKHFKDGLTYIEKIPYIEESYTSNNIPKTSLKNINNYYINVSSKRIITEDGCYYYDNLPIDLCYKDDFPQAYQYAMDMTLKETQQAVEGMFHNLNTLQSRSGNQLPFTSINYGTCTLPEGRMVIKALLEGSIKGVGKFHRTPIFPCGIFQIGKGINKYPGDPNYDLFKLALKSTSQRLYPNYANIDWSGNAGYDPSDPTTYFSTMGCRTANGYDINGLKQQKDGRGNICPVTIILPTLAMEAKESEQECIEYFMELLDNAIDDAKDMLVERFEYICNQDPASAKFMYENGTMEGYIPAEGIRSALKHGTLALG